MVGYCSTPTKIRTFEEQHVFFFRIIHQNIDREITDIQWEDQVLTIGGLLYPHLAKN